MTHDSLAKSPFRLLAILTTLIAITVGTAPSSRADERKLRFVCAFAQEESRKIVLATLDAKGKWEEVGKVDLESSRVTAWIPAQAGDLHLAVSKDGTFESICQFINPEDSKRSLVVLTAKPDTKTYDAHLVDPRRRSLKKELFLSLNLCKRAASVSHGITKEKVEAGQQSVVKPVFDDNGMIRLRVSHLNDDGENKACFDRFVSGNPNTRSIMLLIPDEQIGIRVILQSVFGSLD